MRKPPRDARPGRIQTAAQKKMEGMRSHLGAARQEPKKLGHSPGLDVFPSHAVLELCFLFQDQNTHTLLGHSSRKRGSAQTSTHRHDFKARGMHGKLLR